MRVRRMTERLRAWRFSACRARFSADLWWAMEPRGKARSIETPPGRGQSRGAAREAIAEGGARGVFSGPFGRPIGKSEGSPSPGVVR